MIVNYQTQLERSMYDEFLFTEFFSDLTSEQKTLSKRKLLRALSEVKEFSPLHILILDSLSYLFSIIYYSEDNSFILRLSNGESVSTTAEKNLFIQLIDASITTKP